MTKFRHKLVLIFVVLITAIITSMVVVVNTNINDVSKERIKDNLKVSQGILSSYFVEKNKSYSESIRSLILTQKNIRAVLGTLGRQDEGDLFGDEDGDSKSSQIKESSDLIASTVEDLPLFQKSEVFAILDSSGTVIYSKNSPGKIGKSLSSSALIQAGLKGDEAFSFWSKSSLNGAVKEILPVSEDGIYEVFLKPVSFQSQVKGIVIVGFSLSKEVVKDLQSIARSELGFSLKDSQLILSKDIEEVKPFFSQEMTTAKVFLFDSLGETFVAYPFELKNSMDQVVGHSIMYRSMTKELQFFTELKNLFLIIGLISGILAIAFAFFFSGTVTQAISSLMYGVSQVQKGNLDHSVNVQTKDEFKNLSDAFNNMIDGLKEKEMIKTTFKRYVNPKIVDGLLAEGEKLNLGGERRDVVIFFSDIASFTKISEKQTPEETVKFLNKYLGAMTDIIEDLEGIVDKYIGDAILAYWVITPKNQSGYEKACEAAVRQQAAAEKLRDEWSESKELSGFSMRIGIHGGQALMGNIGSESRMDYTIIGDDVNTAARLESVNKHYGTEVIISRSVKDKIPGRFVSRELDSVYVVGKQEPVSIYELNSDRGSELMESFEAALNLYRQGSFVEAKNSFVKHGDEFSDQKVSQVFVKRCDDLIAHPPESWDGIYKLNEK